MLHVLITVHYMNAQKHIYSFNSWRILSSFWFEAITNSVAIHILRHIFCWTYICILLDICLEAQWLDSMLWIFHFGRSCQMGFPTCLKKLTFSPSVSTWLLPHFADFHHFLHLIKLSTKESYLVISYEYVKNLNKWLATEIPIIREE